MPIWGTISRMFNSIDRPVSIAQIFSTIRNFFRGKGNLVVAFCNKHCITWLWCVNFFLLQFLFIRLARGMNTKRGIK